LVSLFNSTSGKRTRGDIIFIELSAHLTGAGLLSLTSAAEPGHDHGELLGSKQLALLRCQVHGTAKTRRNIRRDRNAPVAA
jgi:hypothetical protein